MRKQKQNFLTWCLQQGNLKKIKQHGLIKMINIQMLWNPLLRTKKYALAILME